MGGEGSMMAANSSLKNNRSQLSKRKDKKALIGTYANVELKEFPKATPEQLREIREKILKQNKIQKIKQLIIFVILIGALILFFLYN